MIKLNNSINTITENGGRISPTDIQDLGKAFMELQMAKKVLDELEKIQKDADKLKNIPKVKNEAYWTEQKNIAELSLKPLHPLKGD